MANKYLYLDDDQDSFTIKWCIEDIKVSLKDRNKEINPPLTDEDCREILNSMKSNHDCTIGINWEVIDVYVDNYIYQRERKGGLNDIKQKPKSSFA